MKELSLKELDELEPNIIIWNTYAGRDLLDCFWIKNDNNKILPASLKSPEFMSTSFSLDYLKGKIKRGDRVYLLNKNCEKIILIEETIKINIKELIMIFKEHYGIDTYCSDYIFNIKKFNLSIIIKSR